MTPLSRDIAPDRFLLWWFEHAEAHGLAEPYRLFYSNYFRGAENTGYVWKHYRRRMKELMAMDLRGRRFLDVGCGLGTEALWAAWRGAEATGIELHQASLDAARKRLAILQALGGVSAVIRDTNLFDLDGQFDVIFLRETFHHLEPREKVVKKLATLLAPTGVLIIEETNGWNPLIQLKYLRVRKLNTVVVKKRPDGVEYPFGNERITTSQNLDRLFAPYGIRGAAEYFRLLPTSLAKIGPIAAVALAVEAALENSALLRPFYLHYSWIGRRTHA